jgi:hypothetical protein
LTLQELADFAGAMKSGRPGAGMPVVELKAAQVGLDTDGAVKAVKATGVSAAPAGTRAPVHSRSKRTNDSFFISTSEAGEMQDCILLYK